MQKFAVPGMAVATLEGARLRWTGAFGVMDAASGPPVSPATIFEAASLSKPVVAQGVLQLRDLGILELDAPITRYLSEAGLDPSLKLVTVRQLLSHTSGLPNWLADGETLKTHFIPGSRFSYSGVGYRLLQRILEAVTGQDLAGYLEANVLRRLGMNDSSFVWRPEYDSRCGTGHDANGQPVPKLKLLEAHAAHSLHSSAPDLTRFMVATMRNPFDTLEPQIAVNDDPPWRPGWPHEKVQTSDSVFWGLGWGLERVRSETFFWQWGDNGSFKALAIGSRDTGRGFVALTNGANGDRLWRDVTALLIDGEHPALDWLEATQV